MLHSLFIVQLAALLVSYCVAQSSTTFNTTVTVGPQYTATQTGVVPDLVVQTAPQLVFGSSDGSYGQGGAQINLPFPFLMYGEPYSSVYVSSSGNLQFGSQSYNSYSYGSDFLPINSYGDYQSLPIFEPFQAQLSVVDSGVITWSNETISPTQRAVLIRYTNISYSVDSTYETDSAVSFDVLLYETTGQIDVRYYRIDIDSTGETVYQIGMQADEGLVGAGGESTDENFGYVSTYFILYDQLPIDATAQAALQSTTITFNFTGLVDSNSTCGGLGYDLSSISQSDLSYWDVNNTSIYYLRVCGAVTQPDCASSFTASGYRRAMACQAYADSNGQVTSVEAALAVYNPNSIYWQYLSNGVRATIQDGMSCSGVTNQPRVTILSYVCDPTAVTATITGFQESPTCSYLFNISTNLACGNGSRYTTGTSAVPSTLTSCQNISGVGYDAVWCPRALNSIADTQPPTLTNLTVDTTLEQDDGLDTISIGFNVNLYGTNYSQLAIDSNGLITFGPDTTSFYLPGPFPDLGLGYENVFPLIAPLWVDTYNVQNAYSASTYNGYIGTSSEGSAPNRQFYVRWSNVEYYSTNSWAVPSTCSFDVVMFENSSNIEVRYYYIAPNPSSFDSLVVGMHGQNASAYTAVQNAPLLTVDVAARLSYSTITYTYTGPTEAAVCGAGVYPQLASIPDLNITSGPSRWWLAPCRVATTSPCSSATLGTQSASVCMSTAGTAPVMLSADNPTATQWTVTSPTSVQSVTQDGAFDFNCDGLSIVVVDYQCDVTALSATISSVAVSGCQYNFVVNSNLLCAAAAPSQSSTGSSPSSSTAAASSASSAASASSSSSASSVPSFSSSSSRLSTAAFSGSSSASSSSAMPSSASSSAVFGSSSMASSSSSVSPSSTAGSSSSSSAASSSAGSSSGSSSSSFAASSSSSSASSSSASPSSSASSSSTTPSSSSSSSATPSSSSTAAPSSTASSSSSSSTVPAPVLSSSSSSSSSAVPAVVNGGGGSGLSGGAIAGIVIGSVVGVVLLCLIVAVLLTRGAKGSSGGKNASQYNEKTELSRPNTDNTTESESDVDLEMQSIE